MARPAGRRGPRLVTLTSDIGAAYAAQMKAVLARSIDPGRIVDLAHDLRAHDVKEAAFVVRAMGRGFPAGTVHVVVVDPGVGGRRAPLAIECREGSYLVGPDNGVLYPFASELGILRTVRLEPGRWGIEPRVGATFDGRDIFAPAAALLAGGTSLADLGTPKDPRPLRLPAAVRLRSGARGEVLHDDHFGNLVTNIPSEWLPADIDAVRCRIGASAPRVLPRARSYEALGPGGAGILGSSFGLLEISVSEGRADRRFRARVGTRVELAWPSSRRARWTVNSARTRHG